MSKKIAELEKKIDDTARRHWADGYDPESGREHGSESSFRDGALSPEAKEYWQQGLYTEEEVKRMSRNAFHNGLSTSPLSYDYDGNYFEKWFEQNKKK